MSRSTCRHADIGSLEPCKSTGHYNNHGCDRSGGLVAADAGDQNTVVDNGIATYVFVAGAVLYAVVRDSPADPRVDGTALYSADFF